MEEKINKVVNKFLASKILTFLVVLILIWAIIAIFKKTWQVRQFAKEVDRIEQKITDLKKNNEELKNMVTRLQSPDYLEIEARKKLDLKKDGETVIIVPQEVEDKLNKPIPSPVLTQNQAETKPIANWLAWFNYFIGKK